MNVISSLGWLSKSYTYRDFFQSYIHRAEDAGSDLDIDRDEDTEKDPIVDEFDLDNYGDDEIPGEQFFVLSNKDEKLLMEDPEELESRKLESDDRVLVCGNSGDDCASIDFFIYNTAYCGLETCHSILVGAFPLALEVIPNLSNGEPLVAAGTYESHIDIWNMREIDRLEPTITLEGFSKSHSKGHMDAVQCLSHSPFVAQLMASGSADSTAKVWDLKEAEVLHSFDHHGSNVQVVQFSPFDASLLLTASFDNTAALCDIRTCKKKMDIKIESEVECAIWRNENSVLISMENGSVAEYDLRKNEKLWELQAHKKPCSAIQLVDDILVTCGLDSKAKVYKLGPSGPTKVTSKNMNAGPLFNVAGSPDDKYLMGFGGEMLVIWDLEAIDGFDKFK